MTSPQITVRRRRLVPKGAYTSEEVEYTATLEKPEGFTIAQAISELDNEVLNLLEMKLPFVKEQPSQSQDPYDNLPWKRSTKRPELETVPVNENLSDKGRELYTKLKETRTLRIANHEYRLSRTPEGLEYLQRWQDKTPQQVRRV